MKDYLTAEQIRALMTRLSRQRRRVDAVCEVCGAPIPGATTRRRYCSNRCAVRAHRQRRRAVEISPGAE
jgi:hypothetical protein